MKVRIFQLQNNFKSSSEFIEFKENYFEFLVIPSFVNNVYLLTDDFVEYDDALEESILFIKKNFIEWVFDVSVFPHAAGVYYKEIKEIQINTNSIKTHDIKNWVLFTEFHEGIREKISKELPEILI